MTARLLTILGEVAICPRRLSLDTPGVHATVPMLRGVWGAALHDLCPQAYEAVFEGRGGQHERAPAFVLRPAAPDPTDAPALEWISIGEALEHDEPLLRAWDVASGMGLGPARRRFHVRTVRPLGPLGEQRDPSRAPLAWRLDRAAWPLRGSPAETPCRLGFPSPLRLMRNGRLIERPTAADMAVAAVRRLRPFLPPPDAEQLRAMLPELLDLARSLDASPWAGRRLDLVRYSGRQHREIEMQGVAGDLDLPAGPGALWPLLAAAQWLHLGKGTVVGLGQVEVVPLSVKTNAPLGERRRPR